MAIESLLPLLLGEDQSWAENALFLLQGFHDQELEQPLCADLRRRDASAKGIEIAESILRSISERTESMTPEVIDQKIPPWYKELRVDRDEKLARFQLELAVAQAFDALLKRDFNWVIQLLAPPEDRLSEAGRRKLKLARLHLGRSAK